MRWAQAFGGKTVLVTGGLGFIGSNLALTLRDAGAKVTVLDALTDGDGGNRENLAGADTIDVITADIGEAAIVRPLVERASLVFNLSGKVSHIDSVRDPLADLHANAVSQLRFLEICRHANPAIRIVHTSTRQIYGKADTPSVTEQSPIRPVDPNGVSKFAADAYHRMFARDFGMQTAVLRLTNTYGPRQLLQHNRQGFIPWFVRVALEGGEITIFGNGQQTRDVTYVADVVEALLRVAALPGLVGQVYNVGSPFVHSVLEIAQACVALAGRGSCRLVPFPPEKQRIDIGSIALDYALLTRDTGWEPETGLESGLGKMIEYYRTRLTAYL